MSQQLRLVRSRVSPQRVFLVPVGVGRNRLVCSSLPRQTPVTLSRDARVAGPRGPAKLAPIHFFTRSELLMFMNCPDCGLKVRLVAPYLLLERCPRCLVRRRQIVEMRVTTDLPNDAFGSSTSQPHRRMTKEPLSSVSTSPGSPTATYQQPQATEGSQCPRAPRSARAGHQSAARPRTRKMAAWGVQ